jgi:hypothetical protein
MKELTATTKNTLEKLTDLELLAMLKADLREFKRKQEVKQQSLKAA